MMNAMAILSLQGELYATIQALTAANEGLEKENAELRERLAQQNADETQPTSD